MVRSTTRTGCAPTGYAGLVTTLAAAALILTMAAPAAAEFPADYQPGRDDNFTRVAEPPLYLAGFILDWVVYRPVHALMKATRGETRHVFEYAELRGTQAKVRYVLDYGNRPELGRRYAAKP